MVEEYAAARRRRLQQPGAAPQALAAPPFERFCGPDSGDTARDREACHACHDEFWSRTADQRRNTETYSDGHQAPLSALEGLGRPRKSLEGLLMSSQVSSQFLGRFSGLLTISQALQGVPRPSEVSSGLSLPSSAFRCLQLPSDVFQAFRALPRPTQAFSGLPRASKALRDLPGSSRRFPGFPRPSQALICCPPMPSEGSYGRRGLTRPATFVEGLSTPSPKFAMPLISHPRVLERHAQTQEMAWKGLEGPFKTMVRGHSTSFQGLGVSVSIVVVDDLFVIPQATSTTPRRPRCPRATSSTTSRTATASG